MFDVYNGIIEETEETYKDLQIDMEECCDELRVGLDGLADTVRTPPCKASQP